MERIVDPETTFEKDTGETIKGITVLISLYNFFTTLSVAFFENIYIYLQRCFNSLKQTLALAMFPFPYPFRGTFRRPVLPIQYLRK